MNRFPDPIALPDSVPEARHNRKKAVLSAAKWGITIRLCIIAFELAGVYLFGSHALMMDALSSLVDIASSVFLVICIFIAERPPDSNHPFGHGRFEPLAGLFIGVMLIVVGFAMLFQHTSHNTWDTTETISPYVWLFPFFALILLEICYQVVIYAAKKAHSPALAADAIHYRIDGLTSLCATIALILATFYPQWGILFDNLGAIVIAILMIGLGFYAARHNLHQVLDSPPPSHYFDRVRQAALRVGGVLDTEKLRIQLYGPDAHIDIDIEVDPGLTVEKAHTISQQVRNEIQKEWPAVRDVMVHIEPFYPNDH